MPTLEMSQLDWLGTAGLALTVAALSIAVYQLRQAGRQTRELKSHSDSLKFVTGSLSTRYIGPFPEYLLAVSEMIDSAEREVRVVVGNPILGYFTSQAAFMAYSQSIERKRLAGVDVDVVCMNASQRRRWLEQQFPMEAKRWADWAKEHHVEMDNFLRYRYADVRNDDLNPSKFLDLLLQAQEDVLRQSFRFNGVQVTEIDQFITLQVWVADRSRAIFAVQGPHKNALSYGLATSDYLFVSALIAMTELYDPKHSSDLLSVEEPS